MSQCTICGQDVPQDNISSICPSCYTKPLGKTMEQEYYLIPVEQYDNVLVWQKNQLFNMIDEMEDLYLIPTILEAMRLLAPIWFSSSYGYKYKETLQRISQKILDLAKDNPELLCDPTNISIAQAVVDEEKAVNNLSDI